jgi:hypothetical protein
MSKTNIKKHLLKDVKEAKTGIKRDKQLIKSLTKTPQKPKKK